MLDGNNSDTTVDVSVNGRIHVISDSSHSAEGDKWSARLWDDSWEGQTGLFGEARLCVATKKWGDGTVDVLVAHDPYGDDGVPTVYAHRHGNDVTSSTVKGPADEVVEIVTTVWGPPQMRQNYGQS